jgi:hypothetical protein
VDRRFDVRLKVMLAQAEVSRELIAGFLSSLEAFVHPFAGSLQKSSREVPNSLCAGMAHLSAALGQIFDCFFRDSSRRPFKIAQKALNPREDAMGYDFLGIVDLKPVATGTSFRAPKNSSESDVPRKVELGSGRERMLLRP